MSNAEIAPEASPFFSFNMPALSSLDPLFEGSAVNTAEIPNYLGSCSKIVGCVRITSLGVSPGSVVAVQGAKTGTIVLPATAGYGTIRLVSQEVPGDDLSVYRVYWTNEVAQSQLITVQSC